MIETTQLSPWLWVAAPLVVVFAYIVFGISGFGSTVISVPLLAHFLPITYLVPLMVLLDMTAAIFVGSQSRQHVSKPELKRLIPFMFAGFVLGVTVLVKVNPDWLRVALATYLSGRLEDKTEIRSTVSTLISISAFSRAILYAVGGLLLHWTIFAGMALLAPFVWLGLRIGARIHVGLTQAQMRRLVGVLLVLTGGSLLVRSLL
jgi:uncharacterized protein